MSQAIPMMRREQRRRLLMNGWLIAGFIVVGTAVTNERGIFRPLDVENAMSATARAFVAIATPPGFDTPRLRDIRSVSSLNPLRVPNPSRDLRRRLADAIDFAEGDPAATTPPQTLASAPPAGGESFQVASNDAVPPAFITPPTEIGVTPQPVPQTEDQNPIPPGAIPEPSTWAMMILGFGLLGLTLRHYASPLGTASSRRRRKAMVAG